MRICINVKVLLMDLFAVFCCIKVLWPNMTFYARRQKFNLQNRSGAEVL